MNTSQPPAVYVVQDDTKVPGLQAHYIRLAVMSPVLAGAMMAMVIAASIPERSSYPEIPPHVPTTTAQPAAKAVVEAAEANLLSLQAAVPVILSQPADVDADLTAIQAMLREQDAVGIVARVTRDEETQNLLIHPIMEVNADRSTHPASAIKMLTASAAWSLIEPLAARAGMTPMEYMQTTMLTVDAEAAAQPGSRFALREGDQISLLGALYAMAGLSANDATIVVLNSFIAQHSDMQGLDYVNAYGITMGMTETHVSFANGLYASDLNITGADNNRTKAFDMARLAAHISFNQPGLAEVFNQPYYSVITSGRVPDDDQVTVQMLEDGRYSATIRTSVQTQLSDSPAGLRLSDTARNALELAKTGFTADGEINGSRILAGFRGPDGSHYVVFLGEIGNNGDAQTPVMEGLRRVPSGALALGRVVEALYTGYDAPPARRTDQMPAAHAALVADDAFCVLRAEVQGTDIQRCPRGQTQLVSIAP